LLRQRLFVFVVVTLLVALGIAAAQGCQGPERGLGGEQRQQEPVQPEFTTPDGMMAERYESTLEMRPQG
jgi:hypothetical protein